MVVYGFQLEQSIECPLTNLLNPYTFATRFSLETMKMLETIKKNI